MSTFSARSKSSCGCSKGSPTVATVTNEQTVATVSTGKNINKAENDTKQITKITNADFLEASLNDGSLINNMKFALVNVGFGALVATPATYNLTNSIFSKASFGRLRTLSDSKRPTALGVILHGSLAVALSTAYTFQNVKSLYEKNL